MALLFMDSFDHYATANATEKWTTMTSIGSGGSLTVASGSGRRAGSSGLRVTYGTAVTVTQLLNKGLVSSGNTLVVGFAHRTDIAPGCSFGVTILQIWDGNTSQLTFSMQADLSIIVRRGLPTGTVLATSAPVTSLNAFTYLEFKAVIDSTAGTLEIRANGTAVLPTTTGLNTRNSSNSTWSSLTIGQDSLNTGNLGSTKGMDFDDLYVLDGSGSAPWNTFLGDCRVDALRPTAEGAASAWSPLSGTDNALMVDDPTPDADTTYVSTVTPGTTDTYVIPDLPVPGATLYGVQINLEMRKEDAGSCPIQPVVRHSGTNYPQTVIQPGTSYQIFPTVLPTNPGTGVAWTEAGFNAAEFGMVRG